MCGEHQIGVAQLQQLITSKVTNAAIKRKQCTIAQQVLFVDGSVMVIVQSLIPVPVYVDHFIQETSK